MNSFSLTDLPYLDQSDQIRRRRRGGSQTAQSPWSRGRWRSTQTEPTRVRVNRAQRRPEFAPGVSPAAPPRPVAYGGSWVRTGQSLRVCVCAPPSLSLSLSRSLARSLARSQPQTTLAVASEQ